jgi:MoxR-like ATPase
MKIVVDYPDADAERAVLDRYADGFSADRPESYGIEPLLRGDDLLALRAVVGTVHVEASLRDYIVRIVRATREAPSFALGASPRAGVALFLAARAEALLAGRDFVTPDDVKELALPVLRHRILLTPEAEIEGESVDSRLTALLAGITAPR